MRDDWRNPVSSTPVVASTASPLDNRSPFRVYSDTVLADAIRSVPADTASVVDVGCGSGQYARFFRDRDIAYHGVDVVASPQWAAISEEAEAWRCRVTFHAGKAETLDGLCVPSDSSFSCSALEHMEDPDAAVRAVAASSPPGAFGIHVVPAPWSVFLYGFHGWRRFPAARLQSLFSGAGFDVVTLYRLGGAASFALHFLWITGLESGRAFEFGSAAMIPSVVSRVLAHLRIKSARSLPILRRIYSLLLAAALRGDRALPWMPVGYAIVVRRHGAPSA